VALWSKREERSKTNLKKVGTWVSVNYILLIILVQGFICLNLFIYFVVLNLVGGNGVSLLGVSLKGLCAVCLLGFLLNADPRWWSSNVKCKVQTIASSL